MTEGLVYSDVTAAAARISGLVMRTPILSSAAINDIAGQEIYFKCENFQPTGAFKQRGAMNAVMSLDEEKIRSGVATHSSGNHGAALAYAAAKRNAPAYIVMPSDTPAIKRTAVQRFGGTITDCEPGMQGREFALQQVVADTGATVIHPYDDYRVMAGQGTAVLELIDDISGLESFVTPVGGGGLLSGTAVVVRERVPGAKLYGVEPDQAADTYAAFHSGEVIPIDNPDTIAEGLKATIGRRNLAVIRQHVDSIVLVSETDIIHTMRLIWEHLKITVEASSAVALAPLLDRSLPVSGKVGVILTGGNVDLDDLPWR